MSLRPARGHWRGDEIQAYRAIHGRRNRRPARWGAVGPVHTIHRENAAFTITLTRDRDGHAVLDEERFGGQFNLGKEFDDHLANVSEEDQRKYNGELTAAALHDGRFISTELRA